MTKQTAMSLVSADRVSTRSAGDQPTFAPLTLVPDLGTTTVADAAPADAAPAGADPADGAVAGGVVDDVPVLPVVVVGPTAGEADLVREHLPLVSHEVRDVLGRVPAHVSRDELTSAAMLALVQAARGFDTTRGVPFAAFARRRIRGAVLDELRDMDWASRSVRRRARELDSVRERLAAAAGRRPSAAEVAAASGLSTAEIARHDSDVARATVGSLHDLPEDSLGGLPGARPAEPEDVLVHRERTAYLRDAVSELPERLRAVVEGYFMGDRPMAEIAAELGVTESRVSQMRAEALVLMRAALEVAFDTGSVPVATGRPGVAARRRAEYVERVCTARRPGARLAYVAASELSRSA